MKSLCASLLFLGLTGGQLVPLMANDSLYWSSSDQTIRRIDLDTGEIVVIYTAEASFSPVSMALDKRGRKLYWGEVPFVGRGRIRRANLDGGDVETIVTDIFSGPRGIAIDSDGERVYWAAGPIGRANFDGSEAGPLPLDPPPTYPPSINNAGAVAIDSEAGTLYWTSNNYSGVYRASLEGGTAEIVVPPSEAPLTKGVTIDVARRVLYYWAHLDTFSRADNLAGIYAAQLNGENINNVYLTDNMSSVAPLVPFDLDAGRQVLYWAELDQTIKRARVGRPADTLGPFDGQILGLALDLSGDSESNPILPDQACSVQIPGCSESNPCCFDFFDVPSGQWVDPVPATGYNYTMTGEGLFSAILDLPSGFAASFEVTTGGQSLGLFGPREPVDFSGFPGGGVPSFAIKGISPPVEASDPTAFPVRLRFTGDTASFRMEALLPNQPPVAVCDSVVTAADQFCRSGASVDGGSYDPDGEPVFISQDPSGPYGRGTTFVTLTVKDGQGASASCVGEVMVLDQTPPEIACLNPETITPPDVPVSFVATAADNCGLDNLEIGAYECFRVTTQGRITRKEDSCAVSIEANTVTILDSGGVGDHIRWTVTAEDGSGNIASAQCELEVANPGHRKP